VTTCSSALNVVALRIPSLRERPADILPLVDHFATRYARANGLPPRPLSPAARAMLLAHPWPGNVRELENTVHRAVAVAEARIGIGALELTRAPRARRHDRPHGPPCRARHTAAPQAGPRRLRWSAAGSRRLERDLIIETLSHCLGNRTAGGRRDPSASPIRTCATSCREYVPAGWRLPPAPGQAPIPLPWPASSPLRGIVLPHWVGMARPSGDVALALGVVLLVAGAGGTASGLGCWTPGLRCRSPHRCWCDGRAVHEAAARLHCLPTVLLLTTLLRLALNVATTRAILTSGHEGPQAAGAVISAFGGFLMGGDVLVGLIVFAILLVVNFVVVTKGSAASRRSRRASAWTPCRASRWRSTPTSRPAS
jgi:hypothetical protein